MRCELLGGIYMYCNDHKIVFFDIYCKDCKHSEKNETEDPCNECVSYTVNINSHKPINFEKKE